ncbi:MAG: LysR family transcriptional regulator [Lachnospiraceae bacterium]|nr:LysR family transcriptional regulator [Lachnospiraceae bacterium]
MTLQQIFYVLEVAEAGSMNKVAGKLSVSQPTLTAAIKDLEKEIGISIFTRNSRGVNLTNDGIEFLTKARQLYQQYQLLMDEYSDVSMLKQKFWVSTQHYSFAVKAFVDTVKHFDIRKYEFAIRETKTYDVISDVSSGRSEIGILYKSSFNERMINKLLRENSLDFHLLGACKAYVYIHKSHPLAKNEYITFEELYDYPCLSFEQGVNGSDYLAEEILSDSEYSRVIKTNDRATMLNLMVGLSGYTLCSGIVCEDLNGNDCTVVPYREDKDHPNLTMNIGYITKSGSRLSTIGELYIERLKTYFE